MMTSDGSKNRNKDNVDWSFIEPMMHQSMRMLNRWVGNKKKNQFSDEIVEKKLNLKGTRQRWMLK